MQQYGQPVGLVGLGQANDHKLHAQETRSTDECVTYIFAADDVCTLAFLPADAALTREASPFEKPRAPVAQGTTVEQVHRLLRIINHLSTVEQIAQRLRVRRVLPATKAGGMFKAACKRP